MAMAIILWYRYINILLKCAPNYIQWYLSETLLVVHISLTYESMDAQLMKQFLLNKLRAIQ